MSVRNNITRSARALVSRLSPRARENISLGVIGLSFTLLSLLFFQRFVDLMDGTRRVTLLREARFEAEKSAQLARLEAGPPQDAGKEGAAFRGWPKTPLPSAENFAGAQPSIAANTADQTPSSVEKQARPNGVSPKLRRPDRRAPALEPGNPEPLVRFLPLEYRGAPRTLGALLARRDVAVDPAWAAMVMAAEKGGSIEWMVQEINRIARDAFEEALEEHTPGGVVRALNRVIFERHGFATDDSDSAGKKPENFFLHQVLMRRRGYCLSLSVVYLGVARRLGLPMAVVYLPRHNFVRWESPAGPINIETTAGGSTALTDAEYRKRHGLSKTEGGPFMRPLSDREFVSMLLNNRGALRSERGDTAGAITDFRLALNLLPDNFSALTNHGGEMLNTGRFDLAIDDLRRAVSLHNALALPFVLLAGAYRESGRLRAARRAVERAFRAEPENALCYLERGQLHRAEGNLDAAKTDLEQAVAMDETLTPGWRALGRVALDQGDGKRAQEMLAKAYALDPQSAAVLMDLFHLAMKRGDRVRAADYLRDAERFAVDPWKVHAARGALLFAAGEYQRALAAFKKTRALRPDDADVAFNIGMCHLALGDRKSAIAVLEKALALGADSATVHGVLARSYFNLRDFERAREHALAHRRAGGTDSGVDEVLRLLDRVDASKKNNNDNATGNPGD